MKKFSIILVISLLTISLLSCATNNTTANSDDDQNTPTETTTKSTEPTPDPEPVIDMDELYRKVFENHSKRYNLNESPELKDLDKSTDPVILYFVSHSPETHIVEDKIWIMEGISSDFANGLLEKYSVDSCNHPSNSPRFTYVHGYYHSAYLDVLFKNVTFEKIDNMPSIYELTRLAQIKGDENHPDRYYYAYEDMKLYYEENGVVYRSVQNVDSPYLHMMAFLYHYQWSSDEPGYLMAFNVDPDEEGTPKKVTVEGSDGNFLEYSIYPSGKVYSEIIQKAYGGHCENPTMAIVSWSEYRAYFPTEELFRATYGDKIKE